MKGFAEFTRKVAAEGIVLLKNENAILPFHKGERIAVFGRPQIDYYRNGTGSGGAVNVAYTVNILEGMRRQKTFIVDEELAGIYEAWIKDHPFDNGGGGWAAEPWHQEEMELSEELLCAAGKRNQKAVVIIGRTAGEDQDNHDVEGSYRLTKEEMQMLVGVCRYFGQVAVLLNVSNIIDMSWTGDERIAPSLKAVLYIWQGAMEGGSAVADVLSGAVTPSGKLTDTIAVSLEDYPSMKNYGNMIRNYYEEDIYVGYRYFSTFAPDRVMYPFGYGLSYTQFSMEQQSSSYDARRQIIEIGVCIENIGAYAGKETVQIYMQAPQGLLGKPLRVLIGFEKTKCLKPGEKELISVSIPLNRLASYDDGGITGKRSCWVLEPGEYRFYIGNSSQANRLVVFDGRETYVLNELFVVEQLEEALMPVRQFQRMIPGEKKEDGSFLVAYEPVPVRTVNIYERIIKQLPKEIAFTGKRNITLRDVYEKKADLDTFIAQIDAKTLAEIVRGEGMSSPKVTPGTAAAFGGVSDELLDFGIPTACAADGPSGIRMEGGGKATQLPIGTLLAATWNVKMIEELYEWEGREMIENHIDTLLGPGMNIRRNPLNGRNFEYYSEDPLITGTMAAAAVKGIRKGGAHATLKHFACNNQETARAKADAAVSERALREIYLKGFEIAVKEGNAKSIMSSYNPINGYWAASNYDLLTTILRNQWGFDGIVMTDWWAKMNHVVRGGEPSGKYTASMVRAQNDLYMVVSNNGAEVNANGDDTLQSLENGELTMGELQQCAKNICNFMMETPIFREGGIVRAALKDILPEREGHSTAILRKEEKIFISMQEETSVEVWEEGVYDVLANCMCPGNNQVQTACSFKMNDQDVSVVQTNGTEGKWNIQKLVKVHLMPGHYRLRVEVLKPGIQINWIKFTMNK